VRISAKPVAADPLGTSVVEHVALGTSAKLDVTNNGLVIDYAPGSSPLTTIRAHVIAARNGGAWDGSGISSSMADTGRFAVGYGEASAVFSSFPATFAGQLVDNSAVLIRLTRYGDANLDGTVNLADFNRLASSFGGSNRLWTDGDFSYDGSVNLQDFNMLAGNFGLSATGPGVTPADWAALASAVPEPAALPLGAVVAATLLRRRHRP